MAPTTLMTFLVRVPPSTRSVSLYGSWDNFSTAYPMQRDTRTGPEHWSGCHSFSNIICDGDNQPIGVPREGGLKMGGTYWYYYKLDDDLEFHNSAEPSTTACPLLPGQLVNVLNVPFALSSSRSRNDSVSSTNSEFCTMDPADKFLNPRPVPAKPSLPRLKTSPTLPQGSWSSSSSPVSADPRRGRSATSRGPSQSSSATRIIQLAKKPSLEAPSRSLSRSSNRSAAIIGALRALKSPRFPSPDGTTSRGRSATMPSPTADAVDRVGKDSTSVKGLGVLAEVKALSSSGSDGELLLRQEFGTEVEGLIPVAMPSFAQHRRQRSSSREPSSLRNPLSRGTTPTRKPTDQACTSFQALETLEEVATPLKTPGHPLTAVKAETIRLVDDHQIQLDLEKRLPTLPNTPSSAYPPSCVGDSPSLQLGADIEHLQSHFSSTTIETGSRVDSYAKIEHSHFSDWTCSTTRISALSENASSIIDLEPMSPPADEGFDFTNIPAIGLVDHGAHQGVMKAGGYPKPKPDGLPSASSLSTISSVASSATASSYPDLDGPMEKGSTWGKFQHYRLPSEDVGSGVTLKALDTANIAKPLVVDGHHRATHLQNPGCGFVEPTIPHSTTMQQLLDELSYLGGMIQQH
ncbi:hypothetical protein EDD37DRAFT_157678 [Exophiala viscosa]|uniref:Uncharacterized protein n=1 Tax=Exophiala viscosa TaxID=2486360 RepID=A0AAN6DN95_9EURO|nr:hypothetical protein EDD36DRAFT_499082 [Exophiala viscosa]KAI1620520.1 hypothetical protein EDD37DRAFT_157678 [Exophiala viscosa]